MFEKSRLDLLVIALPPFAHKDEVNECAKRRIHFLIEKPVALTSEQAWRMVEQSAKAESAPRWVLCTALGLLYSA